MTEKDEKKAEEVIGDSYREWKLIRTEESIISRLKGAINGKDIAVARKLASLLGYCERRLIRKHNRLIEDIEDLEHVILPDYKAKLDDIKNRMNIFAADSIKEFSRRKGQVPLELNKPTPNWDFLLVEVDKTDNELKGWLALEKELNDLSVVIIRNVSGEYTAEERKEITERVDPILGRVNNRYAIEVHDGHIMFSMFWLAVVEMTLMYLIRERKVKGHELKETLSYFEKVSEIAKHGCAGYDMSPRKIHNEKDLEPIRQICAKAIRSVREDSPLEEAWMEGYGDLASVNIAFFSGLRRESSSPFRLYILNMIHRAWNEYVRECKKRGIFH